MRPGKESVRLQPEATQPDRQPQPQPEGQPRPQAQIELALGVSPGSCAPPRTVQELITTAEPSPRTAHEPSAHPSSLGRTAVPTGLSDEQDFQPIDPALIDVSISRQATRPNVRETDLRRWCTPLPFWNGLF